MIKSIVQRLKAGEIDLDEAARQLDEAIQQDPSSASTALAMIRVARGAGQLRDVSYSRLHHVVRGALDAVEAERPAAGRDYSPDEPDETVIAGWGGSAAPTAGASDEADAAGAEVPEAGPEATDEGTASAAGQRDDAGGDDQRAVVRTGGLAPPAEGDEDEEDDDEDAPTVISRLARSRQASARTDEEAAAGADADDDAAGGGAERPDAGAGDAEADDEDEDEDEDEDDPPTVIARLARSRFSSAAAERRDREPPPPEPEPEPEPPHEVPRGDEPTPEPRSAAPPPAGGTPVDLAVDDAGSSGEVDFEIGADGDDPARVDLDLEASDESGESDAAVMRGGDSAEEATPASGDAAADDDEEVTVVSQVAPPARRDAAAQDASDDTDYQPTIEDPESTIVASGAAASVPTPARGDDTGREGPSGPSGGDSASTGTYDRSWTPHGATDIPELQGLGPGSVIKDRFVLEKVLGAGGMGKVYQARDLLKVEARDRNPRVALKVLTEDFKEHPEAFIALQRESSRQQRLAHPNIATVYDFDRIGSTGTQVFITMELMEGYPLNTYIKKVVRPRGGLPPEEAIPMIRQLGAALAYAHKRDIVHSDFKPGNAFLCDDGTMKVLDFGIARAVKAPGGAESEDQEDGAEKTVFDPGELGALTPAYASLEMLEGEEPDPRDDIYALACVAYELLTGYHPFARKSAAKAREQGLQPAPVKTLKRRQMRGLLRGLAFERDKRSSNTEAFVEEIEGRLNWHKNPYVIGSAMAVAVAIASVNPLLDVLEDRRIQQMVAEVQSGEPERIEAILAEMGELDAAARATITDEGRDPFQAHFDALVREAVDLDEEAYAFDDARAELDRAENLYPDSTWLERLEEYVASARDRRLHELNQAFMAALEEDRLLPDAGETDAGLTVPEILARIEAIDADHGLLVDPRVPNTYAEVAQGAINTGDLERAGEYLAVGRELAPDAVDLLNTQARLEAAEADRERRARVATLRERFADVLDDLDELGAFREHEAEIVELARLSPDDGALRALRDVAEPIAEERVEVLTTTAEGAGDAGAFVADYGAVLEALSLHGLMLDARLATVDADARDDERGRVVAEAERAIASALDDPDFDREWEAALRNQLGYLRAALGAGDETLTQVQAAVAEAYMERARDYQDEQMYSDALALLRRARALDLDHEPLEGTHVAIDAAHNRFLREREDAALEARLEGLKETLLIQARALELDAASETLRELDANLPEDDPFLNITAPSALGEAFATVAEEYADAGDYREALAVVRRGLEHAPHERRLNEAREAYTVEVNIEELERLFAEERRFDTSRAARMVDEIRTWAPTRHGRLEPEWIDTLTTRVRSLAREDRPAAERLATRANNVFPGSTQLAEVREEVAPPPWPQGSAARAALSAGRLNEAEAIVERALDEHPDHPEVENVAEDLEERINEAETAFRAFRAALERDELTDARRHLADARSLWVDNRDFRQAQSELSEQLAQRRRQQSRVLQRSEDIEGLREAAEVSGQDVVDEDWDPIASPRPCTEQLAGHGPRARAICYDLIHDRVRGPLLVVIPGGGGHEPFAISKYEISNEDYNKYCFLSGQCAVDDEVDDDLPRTGLDYEEMQDYVEWLSDRTGNSYRLPTVDEWEYAARANGDQPPRDFNCRVRMGDQILKGTSLIDVTVGHQNGWGLKNYIGNAQELVTTNGELVARGGSYRDPHSECSYNFVRPHDGQGDEVTGFRVILEELEVFEEIAGTTE